MKNKIENLLNKDYSQLDEEITSHLQNYVCILISSYLEIEINNQLTEYKKTQHFKTHECMKKLSGEKLQNATWCKIKPILGTIEDDFPYNLKNAISDFELTIQAIQSIIDNRNNIAHGKNINVLTIQVLNQNFIKIDNFVSELKKIFSML
ncbi:hypothetical protein AN286_05015 [Aliarcobacter cryaerophilus ATCC 43158]|uniref:RiboL-PSP-HEPN domain-containing protein n=1 Tax=Aliarcobacter cryaerophilus ATCC 43158 TaxID=1032070 RepID=A0AAD0TSG6_9BACT|nr:HEPN domain-containing protein [Aliarcobacter cryaerophilus]AYJ79533.1 hypothetical protein ACRYA_0376 [Aliarcobacter cryaerophilus ATCC 43158]PRM96986.1 hypothetical protein CJ667_06335 [Aliarcobacter cryaerophilus]QCZ23784.1 hypothetical protein AN286_05015 [Aliarcobacter cryaerophilus ATCC 43158]